MGRATDSALSPEDRELFWVARGYLPGSRRKGWEPLPGLCTDAAPKAPPLTGFGVRQAAITTSSQCDSWQLLATRPWASYFTFCAVFLTPSNRPLMRIMATIITMIGRTHCILPCHALRQMPSLNISLDSKFRWQGLISPLFYR